MIFGVLSLLSATLTLPGIAGIVLTVGIASRFQRVDLRAHPRGSAPRRSAITPSTPASRVRSATILDSNITTFIAAAVLFYIGTGPVRCFAVDARYRHPHELVHGFHPDPAYRRHLGAHVAAQVCAALI